MIRPEGSNFHCSWAVCRNYDTKHVNCNKIPKHPLDVQHECNECEARRSDELRESYGTQGRLPIVRGRRTQGDEQREEVNLMSKRWIL